MLKNIKKIFYSIVLWLALFFVPTGTVRAQFGVEILTAPFVFLAKAIAAFILAVPLSWGFLAFGQIFLTWASNPNLTGGVVRNDFVIEAWGIVRDFSNLFFILIVVAIGIATALRVKQYEVKKTLPKLIAVAVLINFSPVICGVIIDAANIFMNFFLTAGSAGFGDTMTLSQASGDYMIGVTKNAMGNLSEIWKGILFFKLLIITIFNFFAAFVFFMLGALFLVRHIALWILVILSPLAFLGIIFESGGKDSKKISMFARWRQEFIKWTFTGVTAAFFVYLSQLMLHLGLSDISNPSTESTEFGGKIFTNMIKMLVPIAFLGVGYFTSMQTGGMGAKQILKFGTKWAGKVNPMSKGGRDTLNRLRTSTTQGIMNSRPMRGISERMKNRAEAVINRAPEKMTGNKGDSLGQRTKTLARRTILPNAIRERVAQSVLKNTEEVRSQSVAKHKTEADKMENATLRRAEWRKAKRKKNVHKQLGIMQSAIDKGEISEYKTDEIKDMLQKASYADSKTVKKIIKSNPDLAIDMEKDARGRLSDATDTGEQKKILREMKRYGFIVDENDRKNNINTYSQKVANSIGRGDIEKIRSDAFRGTQFPEATRELRAAALEIWGGDKVSTAGRELGRNFIDEIQKSIDQIGFDKLTPKMQTYLKSNGARNLGLSVSDEASRQTPESVIETPISSNLIPPEATADTPEPRAETAEEREAREVSEEYERLIKGKGGKDTTRTERKAQRKNKNYTIDKKTGRKMYGDRS